MIISNIEYMPTNPDIPIDEMLEDIPKSVEEADELFSDHPTGEELHGFIDRVEKLSEATEIEKYKTIINYASWTGFVNREDVRELVNWQHIVSNHMVEEIGNLGRFMFDVKNVGAEPLVKKLYSNKRIHLPDPPEDFVQNFTEYILRTYEGIIDINENNQKIERFIRDWEQENKTENIQTFSKNIDWQDFSEKYGSMPCDEMREFYEAALEYHDEDVEIQPELLTKVIVDMNGYTVEYSAREKELADNLGTLKKAVGNTSMLDYKLPVMGKQREIQRITETIKKIHPFYEKETQVIVR